jgi:hypothetical protein
MVESGLEIFCFRVNELEEERCREGIHRAQLLFNLMLACDHVGNYDVHHQTQSTFISFGSRCRDLYTS